MKKEMNLSLDQALAIISVGNTIKDEVFLKREVKEVLGKIFGESSSEKKYNLVDNKGRKYEVILSLEEQTTNVTMNELISDLETRMIYYSINKNGEIYQSLVSEKDQVNREQKKCCL